MQGVIYNRNKKQILELGNHIRSLRESKGLTQLQLAAKMKRERQSYQRVELGNTNVTFGYLMELAEALEVKPSVIFSFLDK